MRKAAFSLVELLLSMLVIAMLMLLGFATNRALRESTKRRQAGLEVRALAQAMLAYRQDYGVWPLLSDRHPGEVSVSNIVAVLRASADCPETATDNPRGIAYLEFSGNRTADGASPAIDPWGNPYQMAVRWETERQEFAMTQVEKANRDWRGPDGWNQHPDLHPVAVWSWQGKSALGANETDAIRSWEAP
ncbi:MAG: type II secretion system protein [Kiritimatiellia bacterium]|jgi:type II secretory pathway pseudopilin PulG